VLVYKPDDFAGLSISGVNISMDDCSSFGPPYNAPHCIDYSATVRISSFHQVTHIHTLCVFQCFAHINIWIYQEQTNLLTSEVTKTSLYKISRVDSHVIKEQTTPHYPFS